MSKNCPKCGTAVPDDAKFCANCGYSFDGMKNSGSSDIFKNGKIFLILIAVVVVIGAIVIFASGFGGNDAGSDSATDNYEHVYLTITDVGGWESDSSQKTSYTLFAEALFTDVPSDTKGYIVKTTYYDENNTEIGHVIEDLDFVYYESDYPMMFGYYTTYSKPNPDHVTVEIMKDGNVVDSFTDQIDKSTIDFLN